MNAKNGNTAQSELAKKKKRKKIDKTTTAEPFPAISSDDAASEIQTKQGGSKRDSNCNGEQDKRLAAPKTRKIKKDPNAPKRNVGAYSWFMKVNRKFIQQDNPDVDPKEIVSSFSRTWVASSNWFLFLRFWRFSYASASWNLKCGIFVARLCFLIITSFSSFILSINQPIQ